MMDIPRNRPASDSPIVSRSVLSPGSAYSQTPRTAGHKVAAVPVVASQTHRLRLWPHLYICGFSMV